MRLVMLATVLWVTLLAPASAQTFASLTGSVADQSGGLLPGVRLTLVNARTEARYEIRSTATGSFEFVGLPSGDFTISASLPGFRAFEERVTMVGRDQARAVVLQLGELEETLTIVGSRASTQASGRSTDPALADSARRAFQQVLESCAARTGAPGVSAIGGSIRPPRKIRSVSPGYPENAAAAGIGGTVRLEAIIGPDGYVRDVRNATPSMHPDLVNAGIDAVRAWEFDGTLLNCVPVEVTMHVTLQFDVR